MAAERLERLMKASYQAGSEAVSLLSDARYPSYDSLSSASRQIIAEEVKAVAAAVDAEYAPLLLLLEQKLRVWNRHGMAPTDFSDIADRLEALRAAREES